MMKTGTCSCGTVFTYELPEWAENLGGPGLCEECEFKANRRAKVEERQAAIQRELVQSEIPTRFFAHDVGRDPQQIARRAVGMTNRNIFLSGENGIGKTHNLSHAMYLAIKDGRRGVRWIFAPSFFADVCAMIGEDAFKARKIISQVETASLLLIDDMGKEKETERSGEILFCLLDCRLRNGRPTWITSNLSGAEIERKYGADRGPAIRSRLLREDLETFKE